MSENANIIAARPGIQPSPFEFGVTYQGAILEGSFRVDSAREVRRTVVEQPEIFQLGPPTRYGADDLLYQFRVNTDEPVKTLAFLKLDADTGTCCTHYSLQVQSGLPPGGRLLFCASPYGAHASDSVYRTLNLTVRELKAQTNATDRLPADLSLFKAIVLHGIGLWQLEKDEARPLHRYIQAGGRVIVLASRFFRDTVKLANHLTEPYGLVMEDREYGELLCDRHHIADYPLTRGVTRLRWFRPSPIISGPRAKLLVRNPEQPAEGFAACAGPDDNLIVIGTSLLSSLLCEGWPFENGRLFANLLGYSTAAS